MDARRRAFPLPAVLLPLVLLGLPLLPGCGDPGGEETANGLERLEDTLAAGAETDPREHEAYPAPPSGVDDPDRPVSRDTAGTGSGETPGGAVRPSGEDEDDEGERSLPPWTTGRVQSGPPGAAPPSGPVMVRALDHAPRPGYDRWVLHLDGGTIPAYEVEYVDRPLTLCGSGRQIQPEGDGWLRVLLEPARGHTPEGDATLEPETPTPGLQQGLRVYRTCDFEGRVELVLAVRSPEPFRVFHLRDPARIVVDVQEGG